MGETEVTTSETCTRCNGSGIWETGNNDLPCELCPTGASALWPKTSFRKTAMTGFQIRLELNPPYNRMIPDAWVETLKLAMQPIDIECVELSAPAKKTKRGSR